jgi:hypothetical protein
MQILHYENGEKYEPHFDYFHDKVNQVLGGHRIATVLMYLSDVEKGGETIFPDAEVCISLFFFFWGVCVLPGCPIILLAMTFGIIFRANFPKRKMRRGLTARHMVMQVSCIEY